MHKLKTIVYFLVLLLLFQAGCNRPSTNDEYQQIVDDISEQSTDNVLETREIEVFDNFEKDLTGGLSVRLYKNVLGEALLEKYAAAFMEENPDVTIDINIVNLNPETNFEDIVTEANVAFSSGEVEDIVDLTPLPYINYMENGYLEDMYKYLNSDLEIDREEYYWNVLEAREHKQSLPGIALSLGWSMLFLEKDILERIDVDVSDRVGVRVLEIWDWYFKAVEEGIVDEDYSIGDGWMSSVDLLIWTEIDNFIDRENKSVSFVSDEFVALLKKAKETGFSYENREGAQVGDSLYDILDYIDKPLERFSLFWHQNFLPDEAWSTTNKYITQPLIIGSSAETTSLTTYEFYGITSACENKELAWEFLKYCMAGDEWTDGYSGENLTGDMWFAKYGQSSVNRKSTYNFYSRVIGTTMADGIERLNESVSGGSKVDGGSMYQVVEDCVRAYIDEDIGTAESVAQELQSRFEIYLNE